jgi:hypothetical protein
VNAPARPPAGPDCPRCGAAHDPGQEYCLECGYRLQPASGVIGRLATVWQQRLGWYPGDWIWRVLLGLVVAVAGATAAIVLADAGAQSPTIVATDGDGAPHAPTTAAESTTVTLPGVSTGPPVTPTAPPPATTTARPPGSLTAWPGGRGGFTVVLESLPASTGRSLALERAKAASRAGLPQVGVLDSSSYSSLHPGYYVIFSGIYSSFGQAQSAQATAAAKGFRLAYAREITR